MVDELTADGIAAGGQEWADGALAPGLVNGVDFVDFTDINGFSTFGGIWAVNMSNVLPVTWLSVQAIPSGNNSIKVKWTTAGERKNNAGFVVERSQDGQHYQTIASVQPQAENTGSPAYYLVEDNKVMPGTTYYYRIRQIDIDGRSSYSKVVTASLTVGKVKYLQIRPNPVSNILKWEVNVLKSQQLNVSVMDVTGKTLINRKLHADAGSNNFKINVSALKNGAYILKIVDEDGSINTERFMIP